jgi:Flp pilus assembly pilin Flp
MIYRAMGNAHALAVTKGELMRRKAADKSGQGTVEYVGLILLVSLLMVGMVAAMKGFTGRQGTELAELIVDKIQSAVDKVAFR